LSLTPAGEDVWLVYGNPDDRDILLTTAAIPLQILAKQIIVTINNEIVEHELNPILRVLALLCKFISPASGDGWNVSA
jgi:hypothetical protein